MTYKNISAELNCNADYVKEVCQKYRKGLIVERPKKEKAPVDRIKRCEFCGEPFEARRKDMRFCSRNCGMASYNSKRIVVSKAIHEERNCKCCGKTFVTSNDGHMFCSRRCGKAYRGVGRRYTSTRSERLKDAVEYDKSVNLHTLIKRDNNKCSICGRICDLYDYEVTSSGAMICGDSYPTIDHVYPCSRGGSHTWSNVQLACLKCNREKSDSVG